MKLSPRLAIGFAFVLASLPCCGTERAGSMDTDAQRVNTGDDVSISTDLFSPRDAGNDGVIDDVLVDPGECTTWCDCCGTAIETPYPCGDDPSRYCVPCPCVDLGEDISPDTCGGESCIDCRCICADGTVGEVPNAACSAPCMPPPNPDEVCPRICPGYCEDDPCATAAFMTIGEVHARLDELSDTNVWIEGVLTAGPASCTLMECGEDDPCCNDCSSAAGFVAEDSFYALRMPPEASSLAGCWGDECNPYEGCHPAGFGRRVRLEVHIDLDASGRAVLVIGRFCQSPARERRPAAFLSWQGPGGFAGWGPAIVVSGDGKIQGWQQVFGFPPDSPPYDDPHTVITVPTEAVDELFGRWADTDLHDLPHGTVGAECYPTAYARLCDDCLPDLINYSVASQLAPEMNAVWEWFDAVSQPYDARANPRIYCDF